MINFYKAHKNVSVLVLLSILFFLRKGIQYALIGSYVPLIIISSFIVLMAANAKKRKTLFIISTKIWAIALIIWSLIRVLISIVHLTIQPFDGSFQLANQFNGSSLVLSTLLLLLGIVLFRSLHKKRLNVSK